MDLKTANLDRGEKESIALAISKNAMLLMDEERGRDFARQNNLSVRGSLGVLIEAHVKKLISEDQLPEANRLYQEYRKKIIELRDEGEKNDEQRSMVVLHTLIPLKDILTLDFLPEEEGD